MDERDVQWDIQHADGHTEHLTPEILRNRIEHLSGEVVAHRAVIHELLMLTAQLAKLPNLSGDRRVHELTQILERISRAAGYLYGESKNG